MKISRMNVPVGIQPLRSISEMDPRLQSRKPHKGKISLWYKFHFDVLQYQEEIPEKTLGYIIIGQPSGHPEFKHWIKTSPVIKHEGNVIETLNSIYELVGEEVHGQQPLASTI